MPGPPPMENSVRRNADTFTPTQVLRAALTAAPELRNADELREETRAWWGTWTEAPQARLFTATDWERLQMLALLVESYYLLVAAFREGDGRVKATTLVNLVAEVRQNESLLGATHVDRLKGRIKIERPEDGPAGGTPSKISALDKYRERRANTSA